MKIYTRTGDKGKTSLIGGSRVLKHEARIESYGTADELNSAIGLARSFLNDNKSDAKSISPSANELDRWLEFIQHQLFNMGSQLACEDKDMAAKLPAVAKNFSDQLEEWIEACNINLPELKNFILPGGHVLASQLHVCRTICRRAERLSVELSENVEQDLEDIVKNLNRLSDFLFVVARYANLLTGEEDVTWQQDKSEA